MKRSENTYKNLLGTHKILLALILLVIVSAIISDSFLQKENLFNILRRNSIVGIVALGMTFTILIGGIDLSVAAILATVACFSASLIASYGFGTLSVLIIGMLIGGVFGLVNGLVITKGSIQPFIVTFAMMTSARGIAFLYTHGQGIVVGERASDTFKFIAAGDIATIPFPFIIFAGATLLLIFVLKNTRFGRYVYAIGGNEESARLSGINVTKQKIIVYTISGLLAGLAGIVALSYQDRADANLCLGYELFAIAAVVIGGTSLTGGVGGIGGTFIGVLLIGTLDNILNLKGVDPYVQDVLRGIIVILAVLLARKKR